MAVPSEDVGVHRSRLFLGTCLALIPTGASFALVSNILVPLKQEFILTNYQVGLIGGAALWGMAISLLVMGPLLEAFGLKNGARLAFAGHLIGITLMIAAVTRVGDPSAFWMLMGGAATLAAGNGMIEVTGNPLVAALYPDEKTKRLNWFHAFFPIGIVLGGIAGWLLSTYGGRFSHWPYQLAVIYVPILVYGAMVLPQKFPRTENAEVGIPVGEMFRYTLTNPFFLLMITMMAITTSLELGPMRWVPAVLQAGGLHGILVLVWISGWMVVLRALAGHFVERLAPTGMLLTAATLTGTGLFLLSFAQGTLAAFGAATVFAWGVAFFFPTMVGVVSERVPRTGSLGIVLTAGVGLGMAGAVGVPLMGRLADRYLAQALPESTLGVLQRVDQQFPAHVARAQATTDLASLGFRQREVEDALGATRTALATHQSTGTIHNDATANALRAVVATAIPGEPLVAEANGILQPAEASGGQQSFRYVAPGALILILVFGVMYMRDRARGGYKAVKLEKIAAAGLLVVLIGATSEGQSEARGQRPEATNTGHRPQATNTGHRPQATNTGHRPQATGHSDTATGHSESASASASGESRVASHELRAEKAESPVTIPYSPFPIPYSQQGPPRLRVLFLGDNGHHRPTQRAQQLLPALARNGIDLFYTDRLEDLNDTELDRYQALVLYNNHLNVGDAELAALMRFVGDGGGLVVIHCASASFQNSEEFIRLVGAAFKSHGTGTFSAVRVEAAHPAIAGVPVIESWDETYVHTKHNPVNRTVLEVRRENGHDEPWTWVRTYGKGRVFYTAWGHDQRTWGHQGFQQLIGQGIRWTIGDWAMTQIARDPETRQVKLDVPLPTYKRPPAPWNVLDTVITVAQAALPTTESLRMMTLRPHFRVEPFATEPMIGNIIDFTWDARGRMWAVETNDYPNTVLPDSVPGNDRILIIEDGNRDGRADRVKVFATGLNLATSLTFAGGGLVVGQAPHMLFFRDTNGDDKADERKILFTGWPRTDTHGAISNLRYGFDNQVWGSVGYNGFRGTVGANTYERGQFGAGYFRFPADASALEYVARTSNNTWGVAFSEDGFVFGSTANSRPSNFVHIPIRYYRGIGDREPVLPDIADRLDVFPQIDILQVDQFGRYTAAAAHEIYTARSFPKEYWNRAAFVAEPTAHVIGQFELNDNGSGFRARNRWSFMSARDAWVAPVQVKVGPDGALWVSDFYTLVAQHNPTPRNMMGCCQTGPGQAYETPNRDRLHGRVYRIVYDSARQAPARRLDPATPQQLVAALADDNMFWRQTAQRLLVERKAVDAVPALIVRANDHTVDSLGLNPGALHALWTLHGLGALPANADAMAAGRNALRHPAASVRRAALMMLPRDAQLLTDILSSGILPDRGSPWPVEYTVPNAVLSDADMHVRLEATLAVSELPPSDRSANVVRELFASLDNARDPWMPDAIAIAAAGHGPAFLGELMLQRVAPNTDSITVNGLRRVVQRLARLHATKAEIAPVVSLINTIPRAHPGLATALLEGIATGWPEERAPQLTPEQRATLVEAARTSAAALGVSFDKVAARWTMPNVFRVP